MDSIIKAQHERVRKEIRDYCYVELTETCPTFLFNDDAKLRRAINAFEASIEPWDNLTTVHTKFRAIFIEGNESSMIRILDHTMKLLGTM